jgi:ribosome biogenesis GTPase
VSYQREVLVQPGRIEEPDRLRGPLAAALPRALFRRLGRIVAGDQVEIERRGSKPVVAGLLPRRSEFRRTGAGGRSQLLFSNLDLLVLCATPSLPPFRPGLVDRLLLAARLQEIEPLLVLNKTDLVEPEAAAALLEPYRRLGTWCLATSAERGDGLEELASALKGRCAALAGHSGVGKSSLINRLVPDAALPVGQLIDSTGKGQHTTTRVRLLPLPESGFLMDSPGLRMFGLPALEPRQVARLFPGFEAMPPCRFSNCLHLREDGCSVLEALGQGKIGPERYLSYQRILREMDPALAPEVAPEAAEPEHEDLIEPDPSEPEDEDPAAPDPT